jgi:hypothetical protein
MICKKCGKEYFFTEKTLKRLKPERLENQLCCSCMRKETNLKKYGVDNPAKNIEIKEKIKNTNLERYGTASTFQNKEVRDKFNQTCLERYGVEWPWQNKDIYQKRIETHLKKYGVEYPLQSKEVQKKIKQTYLDKYGVEFPGQIEGRVTKKSYCYKDLFFDSSWELCYYIYLEEQNLEFSYKPASLHYEIDGKQHRYFPDFLVEDELVELKGDQFFDKDNNLFNPYNGDLNLEKQKCMTVNNVKIISLKEMKPIIKELKEKFGNNFLDQYSTKGKI